MVFTGTELLVALTTRELECPDSSSPSLIPTAREEEEEEQEEGHLIIAGMGGIRGYVLELFS